VRHEIKFIAKEYKWGYSLWILIGYKKILLGSDFESAQEVVNFYENEFGIGNIKFINKEVQNKVIAENKKCSECGKKQIRGEDIEILINGKSMILPTYNFMFASMCGDICICDECSEKLWKDAIKIGNIINHKEV